MQPISAVFTHGHRRSSTTDPAQLITNTYQYNHLHHQQVMEAMRARSDSLSSSKSGNLDGDTPTKGHELKKSPSDVLKRNSLSPNPSLKSNRSSKSNRSNKSNRSSNLGEDSPTKAHRELKAKTDSLLTTDEARTDDVTKRSSMSLSPSLPSNKSSNADGETPITELLSHGTGKTELLSNKTDNKVTAQQTVCEGKANWIKKNLCCCFYKEEEQSQV